MALSRVQATGKVTVTSATSIALTFASPPTLGNGLVVAILTNKSGGTPITSFADNQGNTYTLAKYQATVNTDAEVRIYWCRLVTVTGASFTITATAGGASFFVGTAIEVSGGGSLGLGIDQAIGTNGTGTAIATGTTGTLLGADNFLVAAQSLDGAATTITVEVVSPTWTQEAEALPFTTAVGEIDSRVVTGAATASCSWTNTGSAVLWAAAVVAFRADALAAGIRVSQVVVETLTTALPAAGIRISQVVVETLTGTPPVVTDTTTAQAYVWGPV